MRTLLKMYGSILNNIVLIVIEELFVNILERCGTL